MKYLLGVMMFFFLGCSCDEKYICNESGTFTGSQDLLDSVWMTIPNIVSDESTSYTVITLDSTNDLLTPTIESFTFTIKINDELSYQTSNHNFIQYGNRLQIPRDSIFGQNEFVNSKAIFDISISLIGEDGFIGVEDAGLLMLTCETINSGNVNDADCRYPFQILANGFGEPVGPCM